METFGWAAAYLALAAVCFYILYANAVDLNGRLDIRLDPDTSVWQQLLAEHRSVARLLALDFCKIHCPWNKDISVRYRVAEARSLLAYMTHRNGWTVADCNDPAKHQAIARDCFKSRTRFWLEQIAVFITSPLRLVVVLLVVVGCLVVMSFVDLGSWLRTAVSRK